LDQLIQATYAHGSASQIKQRMDAYQVFMAQHLPVLWMPWFPQGYARITGFSACQQCAWHSQDVQSCYGFSLCQLLDRFPLDDLEENPRVFNTLEFCYDLP
jgi:hypothetical protein